MLNTDDKEFVEIHEVHGVLSADVIGAFKAIEAISRGTRCKQPFVSVSLSPPPEATVKVEAFEVGMNRVEVANGLQNLPRVVIFYEKEGRRHAHVVWSRIDPDTMAGGSCISSAS